MRDHVAMSVALAEELRAHAKAREPLMTRPGGFMAVRIRDDSGIDRNARWRGADAWIRPDALPATRSLVVNAAHENSVRSQKLQVIL
jgi:hypothetical protein